MSSAAIEWEAWGDFWPEGEGLARAELEEFEGASGRDYAFAPCVATLEYLADLGALKIATGRVEGRLVGFISWVLEPNLESAPEALMARQGAFYVKPDFEGLSLGLRLWNFSMDELRTSGVHRVLAHHPVVGRGQGLRALFLRSGFVPSNIEYSLKLRGTP